MLEFEQTQFLYFNKLHRGTKNEKRYPAKLHERRVYEAFRRVIKFSKADMIIGGHNSFLFLNQNRQPMTATNYNGLFRRLAAKCNKSHDEALTDVMTLHTLRHTFCTKLANAGMNPKALQYIMGHFDITMALNYYTHATFNSAIAEWEQPAAA